MMERPQQINGVQIPYDEELSVLQARLSARNPQTWAAFEALGANPTTKALEILLEQASSTNLSARGAAIRAIGKHSQGRSALAVVLKLLQDPAPYVVREACLAAARLKLTEVHSFIKSLLKSPEVATRRTAVEALRTLWQASDLERIIYIFSHDQSDEVRKEAGQTLKANASKDNWHDLFKVLQSDVVPRHRVWAVEIVGEFGSKTMVESLLIPMLEDKDGHVRKAAQGVLAKVNNS